MNSTKAATHAARDIIAVLEHTAPASLSIICDEKLAALKKLAKTLRKRGKGNDIQGSNTSEGGEDIDIGT